MNAERRLRAHCESFLPKGIVDRWALWREEAWAVFGDVQTIFQAYAELAVDCDHRFVAETHAGGDLCFVAAYEIGPLVAVEPYSVAGAVRQAGEVEKIVMETLPRINSRINVRG